MNNTTLSQKNNPPVHDHNGKVKAFNLQAALDAEEMSWRYNGFLIDWLTFVVISPEQQIKMLEQFMPVKDDWSESSSGQLGYTKCYRNEGIAIHYDHVEDLVLKELGLPGVRGICVQISGKGCRYLETGNIVVGAGWTNLLRTLTYTPGVHVTRLDLAFDDKDGLLDLPEMKQKLDKGEFIAKARRWDCHTSGDSDGAGSGMTLNIGRRVSEMMIRCYDKFAEQSAKGQQPLDCQQWTRVELESKGDNAQALAMALADVGASDAGRVAIGVLRNYLTFRDRSDDSNKSRWPVSQWWENFLCFCERFRLAVARKQPTLSQKEAWVRGQVSATLALLYKAAPSKALGRSLLNSIMEEGERKLRPKHHKLLDDERRSQETRQALLSRHGVSDAAAWAAAANATGF